MVREIGLYAQGRGAAREIDLYTQGRGAAREGPSFQGVSAGRHSEADFVPGAES
jgi:hypothetical protein